MRQAKRAREASALFGMLGAALAGVLSQPARAGDSYISVQGNFSAQSQIQLFDFSLGANSLMTARTWGSPGGTNAAGELIAGGGIDSALVLLNSNLVQLAVDDDGGGGLNSQIANSFPAGNYFLRLSNPFLTQGDGHWDTDISAGTNVTASIETPGSASFRSVTLGGNAGGSALLQVPSALTLTNSLTLKSGGNLLQTSSLTAPTINVQPGAFANITGDQLHYGFFNQTGGTVSSLSQVYVALDQGSNAIYEISGGDFDVDNLQIGWQGQGTFVHSGGNVRVTNTVIIGGHGGNSSYTMSGAATLHEDEIIVGYLSTGTFTQSGGLHSAGAVIIGAAQGVSGTYTLSDGTLTSTNVQLGSGGSATFTQAGGTHTVSGPITFTDLFNNGNGTYNLQGGTLTVQTIDLKIGGTFNQSGGTLNATTINQTGGTALGALQNQGTFNYSSGAFNGRLVNQGIANLNGNFLAGDGVDNQATLNMGAWLVTLNGFGLNNTGTVTLGGAFLTGLGPLVNNNLMSGYGTISGLGGFTNNGTLSQGDGNLTIGVNSSNFGGIDLNTTRVLQINSGIQLSNRGTLNLNGALVSGPGVLNNLGGGVIRGRGTIASTFVNTSGTLLVDSVNVNATGGFGNGGLVLLKNQGGLAGGTINNFGRIQGDGSVGNAITNNGRIEAVGTLSLGGAVTNNAGGLLTAGSGSTLLMSNGISTSAGTINLTGGSFDNNGFPLDNTGQISGFGVFYSSGLTNHGTITFTGGFSTINGSVNNTAGKQLRVAYNPALFTGNVTNNGIFKSTSTTVTFAGTYIENGTFISDPADNFFNEVLIGEQGAWIGSVGDRFFLSGDLLSSSKNKTGWQTAQAELKFLGGGDHVMSVPGEDLGSSFDGYSDNFGWGTLALDAGDSLSLADGDAVPGGALYVHRLLLGGGVGQIGHVAGNGLSIYYDLTDPGNAYLRGQTYSLIGGGSISPVPEPQLLVLGLFGALGALGRRHMKR